MELQKAIEILEHHQQWRLGKIDDMRWEPRELTDALDLVLEQVKNCLIADVGGSLCKLADKYEKDALERYEKGDHALSNLHMAAQARYGFEDGWNAAKKQ